MIDDHVARANDSVENMREMAQLHVDHWPEGELVITLREISEGPPPTE